MKIHLPLKLALSALSLGALLITVSCEDDEVGPFEPDQLAVAGPEEVAPGDTATYKADLYENATYAWSVPTGATVVGGEGTAVIDVTFTAAGSGDITVAARGVNGTKTVKVVTTAPVVDAALDSDVVLSEGQASDVLITFDKDIATAPEISLLPSNGVIGSTISAVEKVDDRTFRVTYTAGSGDGADQISIDKAVSSEFFGSVAMDTVVTFDSYEVDNTSATGELFASRTPVSDSTMVTLSAIFSESLSTTDSVKVSVNGLTTAYITDASMTTQDGMTWTYEFQPEGGANEIVAVSVGNLPNDLAGNPTEAVSPIALEIKND